MIKLKDEYEVALGDIDKNIRQLDLSENPTADQWVSLTESSKSIDSKIIDTIGKANQLKVQVEKEIESIKQAQLKH